MQNRFTVQFTARRLKEKFDKATKFEINLHRSLLIGSCLQEQQAMLHKGRTGGGGGRGRSLARFTNLKNRGSRTQKFVFPNHENKKVRYSFQ